MNFVNSQWAVKARIKLTFDIVYNMIKENTAISISLFVKFYDELMENALK